MSDGATFTPGAERAAKVMCADREIYIHGGLDSKFGPETKGWAGIDEVAEIISRETGDRELLEALEHGHVHFLQDNKLTEDDREVLDEMWAAIKRARGQQ